MIIENAEPVRSADPSVFAWSNLRRFQNVEMVTDRLMAMHKVAPNHRKHVVKQATQIRYCLIQAREYFQAASTVSLATRPNLLYYGVMSLALAEILFKQSGDSSLDKARADNRHHGLSMTVGAFPKVPTLRQASEQLRARPLVIDGQRKGTFALWHLSSREHPLVGKRTEYLSTGGSTFSYDVVYGASDDCYEPVPQGGLTLADVLSGLPLLAEHLNKRGMQPALTRGSVALDIRGQQDHLTSQLRLILHPNPQNQALIEGILLHPSAVNFVELHEVGTGYQLNIESDWRNFDLNVPVPHASMIDTHEFRMWCNKPTLNEFGHIYVATYLAGNYARYFPDQWLLDVETATPLALAIEELCDMSAWRAPWLTLCELERTLYVQQA